MASPSLSCSLPVASDKGISMFLSRGSSATLRIVKRFQITRITDHVPLTSRNPGA